MLQGFTGIIGLIGLLAKPFIIQQLVGCRTVARVQLHDLQQKVSISRRDLATRDEVKGLRRRTHAVDEVNHSRRIFVGDVCKRLWKRAKITVHAIQHRELVLAAVGLDTLVGWVEEVEICTIQEAEDLGVR